MSTPAKISDSKFSVFISYARKDIAFARRLVMALDARGITAQIDERDLPALEDWRRELLAFIQTADTVVFVISPSSVRSRVCAWEVQQVVDLSKRLAPVVLERVVDDQVPDEVSKINYLFFDAPSDFEAQADRLARALLTDAHWIREHTRLTALAARWNGTDRPTAQLLRTGEIDAAAQWAERRPPTAPLVPELLNEFLLASRRFEDTSRRRARRTKVLVGMLVLLSIGAGLGWWKQDWLREQTHWHLAMGPQVLTAEAEKAKAAKLGSDFTECASGCPTMIVIQAGKFMMGSPVNEDGRDADEGPQHEVTIARPFAVSRTEVTFAEWDACVAAGVCFMASDNNAGRGDRPVTNVSWDDAQQYVAWLSRITGKAYRLLSEAEWEYAARAGSRLRFSFGDDDAQLDDHAWLIWQEETEPVRKKPANAFGLHDMHGNAFEWVEDCSNDYTTKPDELKKNGHAWISGDCSRRVVRGGFWTYGMLAPRSASRARNTPDFRHRQIGFRLARTLDS